MSALGKIAAGLARVARAAGDLVRDRHLPAGLRGRRRVSMRSARDSRWESVDSPQAMGPVADRLLRLAVAHGEPADEYPASALADLDQDGDRTALLRMRASRTGWDEAAAA